MGTLHFRTPAISILKHKQDLFYSRKVLGRVDGARKVGAFPLVETKFYGNILEGLFLQRLEIHQRRVLYKLKT